ncbi:MAG: FAD-dependent oxidoreductase [Francisellaceae bacterium]|nr:FAD-dependent oxidoreductase [Francisellaceae bacterium]
MDKDRIAIVGMGPGGMATALELAKNGQPVTIFENRDHFARSQKVILDDQTISFMNKLLYVKRSDEDIAFMQKLRREGDIVEIKELQHFLKRKMETLYPGLIEIKQGKDIKITAIDAEQQTLSYTENDSEETLKFQHIVAADGARHAMVDLLQQTADTKRIQYEELERQTRQKAHGTVTLTLNSGVTPRSFRKKKITMDDIQELRKLGWDNPYLPKLYTWPNEDVTDFYIAGEIPEIFLEQSINRESALEQWGQKLLEIQYGYTKDEVGINLSPGIDAETDAIDRLKTTAFPVTLYRANTNFIDLGLEDNEADRAHIFYLMGDAAKSPNFHLGHGCNDSISDGLNFARAINQENGNVNTELLSERHENAISDVVEGMKDMEGTDKRENKEVQALLAQKVKDKLKSFEDLTNKLDISNKKKKIKRIKSCLKKNRNGEAYEKILSLINEAHEAILNNPESVIEGQHADPTKSKFVIFNSLLNAATSLISRVCRNKKGHKNITENVPEDPESEILDLGTLAQIDKKTGNLVMNTVSELVDLQEDVSYCKSFTDLDASKSFETKTSKKTPYKQEPAENKVSVKKDMK